MKKILGTLVLLGCITASCSNIDSSADQDDLITRTDQSIQIDLLDFGKVHNMMMDYAQTYLNQESTSKKDPFSKDLISALKGNMATFLNNTTINMLSDITGDAINNYIANQVLFTDEHFFDPIENLEINGEKVTGRNIIEQVYNCGAISKDDKDILNRLASITVPENSFTLNMYSQELQNLFSEWQHKYGESTIITTESEGLYTGMCIFIGMYSSQWWGTSYTKTQANGPQKIAPWLAALAMKDLKGAIKGLACHLIACSVDGTSSTFKGAATAALVGAGMSSIGCL